MQHLDDTHEMITIDKKFLSYSNKHRHLLSITIKLNYLNSSKIYPLSTRLSSHFFVEINVSSLSS